MKSTQHGDLLHAAEAFYDEDQADTDDGRYYDYRSVVANHVTLGGSFKWLYLVGIFCSAFIWLNWMG